MELNEKGQCPVCKRKPRPYKRQGMLLCIDCNRQYDINTHEQQENFAWIKDESGEWVDVYAPDGTVTR